MVHKLHQRCRLIYLLCVFVRACVRACVLACVCVRASIPLPVVSIRIFYGGGGGGGRRVIVDAGGGGLGGWGVGGGDCNCPICQERATNPLRRNRRRSFWPPCWRLVINPSVGRQSQHDLFAWLWALSPTPVPGACFCPKAK